MLAVLAAIALLFKILVVLLVGFFVVVILPAAALMINDEFAFTTPKLKILKDKPSTAKHRRAPGATDEWMAQRVAEFREGRMKIQRHVATA